MCSNLETVSAARSKNHVSFSKKKKSQNNLKEKRKGLGRPTPKPLFSPIFGI
jgi:hypothetical protein